MEKPSYRSSRRFIWVNVALAWLVILILCSSAALGKTTAVDIATIALPSMVAIVVGSFSVHRGFGSLDMRTMGLANSRGTPPAGSSPPEPQVGLP